MASIYFASDVHLKPSTRDREKNLTRWLDEVIPDMEALYLVGDVFDFWFDYKTVIPRGYVQLLSKLTEIRNRGIPIYFFTGNHDMWMFDYFTTELGIPIYHEPIELLAQGKKIWIGHGDGLGPGDHGYKFIKRVFKNRTAQFLFRWLHPDLGTGLASYFSSKSREAQDAVEHFLGPEKEWLIQYVEEMSLRSDFDYYIFGHRHLPIFYKLQNGRSHYVNLGDWITFRSYGRLHNGTLELLFYENEHGKIYP